jgi:GH15 family glucan-1,4-alpha-glucosidase
MRGRPIPGTAAVSEADAYPPLATLAAIGDGRSLALLGPDVRVEWFCPGRFDAPPAVWPILDRRRGGHLHIAPVDCVCTAVGYLPDTGVLRYGIGGVRNWDYRYTWLRDAGFTLNALYALGCTDEARAFARWLCATTSGHGLPLRVLYGIDGGTEFPEEELDELEGYRGSRPVRVGNGAETQLQLDSYGELLDCLTICEVLGEDVMRSEWPHFRRLVDFVAEHWHEPDSGIWEVRDDPRHFVHSKAMAWVALDRGCRLVDTYGLDGDLQRWRREADTLRAQILDRGVVEGRFRRAYDDDSLDASLLMLPIVGFVDGTDPLALATLTAVRDQLSIAGAVSDAFLLRYPSQSEDGLAGSEGAFAITSFWLVEAQALAGQADEAAAAGEALIALQGLVGLYAEEFDPPTGAHLGNVPQAFTHIGLINAALRMNGQSMRGDPKTSFEASRQRADVEREVSPSPPSP